MIFLRAHLFFQTLARNMTAICLYDNYILTFFDLFLLFSPSLIQPAKEHENENSIVQPGWDNLINFFFIFLSYFSWREKWLSVMHCFSWKYFDILEQQYWSRHSYKLNIIDSQQDHRRISGKSFFISCFFTLPEIGSVYYLLIYKTSINDSCSIFFFFHSWDH